MKRLLAFFLDGCWHQWETIDTQTVDYKGNSRSGIVDRYILRCKHCGKIKTTMAW